jgi:hypothetical protein
MTPQVSVEDGGYSQTQSGSKAWHVLSLEKSALEVYNAPLFSQPGNLAVQRLRDQLDLAV